MKTLKEKKLLVRMQTAMGEAVDPKLLQEITDEEARIEAQSTDRKAAFQSMFANLSKDIGKLIEDDKKKTAEEQAILDRFANVLTRIDEIKATHIETSEGSAEEVVEVFAAPPTEEELKEIPDIVPEVIAEKSAILAPAETQSLADFAAKRISAEAPPSMFVQPEPALVSRDIKDIQQKLKLMEAMTTSRSTCIKVAAPIEPSVNTSRFHTSKDVWFVVHKYHKY